MSSKPAIRPLRARYNPDAPYVVERHDDEEGGIQYEIIDKRPDSYRRLCTISDEFSSTRAQAKRDADMIVKALNALHQHEALAAAAQRVLDGLNRRIEEAAKRDAPHPVFEGIGDLHDALSRSKAKGG